jgi:hypothetical protein
VSDINPSSAAASGEPQDIQQLVAMLGNLMPLLLRLHSPDQPFQPFQGVRGNVVIPNPALDQQAAVNLVGDITADALRNLSAYLETNAGHYSGLESCVPVVTQAAQRFAARDYAQAFNLIWHAYRIITTLRAADPRIPAPRTEGQARSDQAVRSDQTQSVH